MILRWLFSPAIREAVAIRKHVKRLLEAQRDLLPRQAIVAMQEKLKELNAAIAEGNKGRVRIKAEELQFAAEENIKSYPHPVWRENVEVLLVAITVAMGIRTFFLLPNKIPTGSMQPTLYGVTSTPDFSGAVRLADEVVGEMPASISNPRVSADRPLPSTARLAKRKSEAPATGPNIPSPASFQKLPRISRPASSSSAPANCGLTWTRSNSKSSNRRWQNCSDCVLY